MRFLTYHNTMIWLAALTFALTCATSPTHAGDLPAVGDGEHLWLTEQAPAPEDDQDAGPQLTIYHLPANTETYYATKLDPIAGELMPRGLAAGDDRLLIVTNERQVITLQPVWSELLLQWVYKKRTLPALPEGCTLVSLAIGERGPWALVQVQSRELLDRLDQQQAEPSTPTDQQILNKALGLPEDLQWDESGKDESKEDEPKEDETAAEGDDETPVEVVLQVEPVLPAYRLIHLRSSKWISSPLPRGFTVPREVALLIRPGDDRPTLLIDGNSRRGSSLVRYNPVTPTQRPGDTDSASPTPAPTWTRLATGMYLPPGRQWSADIVNGQIVIALERYRPREHVTVDAFLLRGDDAYEIGSTTLSTGDNARWALLPKQNDIALIAAPAPPPKQDAPAKQLPTMAFLAGLSLDGQPMFQNKEGIAMIMPIAVKKPGKLDGNADLFIQILAFITAMFMMVMFYRRAPQQDQLDLPDHLVLASFGRRAMGGLIDLAPGFFLATLIYDLSVTEILLEAWPGNGVEKAFAAMRPGFVVIGVTLFHTTICEFILARSLGKIVMGMYVADLNGKPAPPGPCFGRALSRAFELFAPLMILVAVISPARQRLGDILAKTTVVMRKPEPIKFDEDDEP